MPALRTSCFSYLTVLFLCLSCKEKTTTTTIATNTSPLKKLEVLHAKGFSVDYYTDYKLVTILQSGFKTIKSIQYALIDRNKPRPINLPTGATVLEIPLQSMICLSTTHAPLLTEIGEIDKVIGFADSKYSGMKALQEQVKNGKTKDIVGQNGTTNIELIVSLQAQAIMSYSEKDYHALTKLGQKVLINTEYLEVSPLGRAEWIKFGAVFFNKEELAEQFFKTIENEYMAVKQEVAKISQKPTIFGTIPYSGTWYMPAGQSFAATIWKDAGGLYAWQDSEGTGSLQLSIEQAIMKAQHADIWINTGSFASLNELLATDNRFTHFKAVKTNQVYNCNKRVTAGGGSEFYEYGVIRPDIVLKDLVKILHPDLLPTHELFFYQKLK